MIIINYKRSMNNKKYVKPILKWVGGKTQIIDKIIEKFPRDIENYHELFLGGGSVLFAVLSSDNIKIHGSINAYDINNALIHVYKNIQEKPNELYSEINKLIIEYKISRDAENDNIITNKIQIRNPKNKKDALRCRESYYYWIRNEYNKLSKKNNISASSKFIFLNKTCFRGIFREGPNGFNVPYGHYNNIPEIISKNHILKVSTLIKNVNFRCLDFKDVFKNRFIKTCDFIYLDPPYVPINRTSFVGYTNNGFNGNEHKKLFNMIRIFKKYKTNFVMSNSYSKLILDNFSENEYKIEIINCKRSINSKKPDSMEKEVLISLKM